MTLSKSEMMVVAISVQLTLLNNHECACDQDSGFCFVCESSKLLKRMARETGMPLQSKVVRKTKVETLPELTLSP